MKGQEERRHAQSLLPTFMVIYISNKPTTAESSPGNNLLSSLASRRVAICLSGAKTSESICEAIQAEWKMERCVVFKPSQQHQNE